MASSLMIVRCAIYYGSTRPDSGKVAIALNTPIPLMLDSSSIVDFEHYNPAKDPINMNEIEELQKWGLVRRPPPTTWWAEWGLR
nr:hypothetical protein CFP56_71020 [Quercus suber]